MPAIASIGRPALSESEQFRLDAFLQLTRLERGLRRYIETELSKCDGSEWPRKLPQDIREKVASASLDFTDFPDLKKILGSAWQRLGKATEGVNKQRLLVHLEGLEPIRNDIAHSREITPGALALIQAAYYVALPLLQQSEPIAPLPPTVHPEVALSRIKASICHSSPVHPADLAVLEKDVDYRGVCDAVGGYERVRSRPGRLPSLMSDVRTSALQAIADSESKPG